MLPFPVWPLAGQSILGQNVSCGFIGFSPCGVVTMEYANEPLSFQGSNQFPRLSVVLPGRTPRFATAFLVLIST
jgi:hypothetical protein